MGIYGNSQAAFVVSDQARKSGELQWVLHGQDLWRPPRQLLNIQAVFHLERCYLSLTYSHYAIKRT
jgi:hypothetical protein